MAHPRRRRPFSPCRFRAGQIRRPRESPEVRAVCSTVCPATHPASTSESATTTTHNPAVCKPPRDSSAWDDGRGRKNPGMCICRNPPTTRLDLGSHKPKPAPAADKPRRALSAIGRLAAAPPPTSMISFIVDRLTARPRRLDTRKGGGGRADATSRRHIVAS